MTVYVVLSQVSDETADVCGVKSTIASAIDLARAEVQARERQRLHTLSTRPSTRWLRNERNFEKSSGEMEWSDGIEVIWIEAWTVDGERVVLPP